MPPKTQQVIISVLARGPLVTARLVETVMSELSSTRESVYAALRIMEREQIVTILGRVSSLSLEWIHAQANFHATLKKNYHTEIAFQAFIRSGLSSKKKVKFTFPSLSHMDIAFRQISELALHPQEKPTPYFHIGFTPWLHTLYPDQAIAYAKLLVSLGYIPCSVTSSAWTRKHRDLDELRAVGMRFAFVDDRIVPEGFEAEYVHNKCFQVHYEKEGYTNFKRVYNSTATNEQCIEAVNAITPITVHVYEKKNLFAKKVLDLLDL